jgi:APA family basic amino acid/polyamine antiporter
MGRSWSDGSGPAPGDSAQDGPAPDGSGSGQGTLARRLGLDDAVVIGLGSMIGAGVFAVWAPAAAAAGSGLLIGLAVAALVAFCNATSSAQLAARFPTSGGSYVYGREVLGPWAGFFAGWSFVVGKAASSAAMALTFAHYLAPGPWLKPVAAAAVVVLTIVNGLGVTRTAALARVLVVVAAAALLVVAVIGFVRPTATGAEPGVVWSVPGVLQSAGLLFFAFAGYARIATLGEEVADPVRTIPRAITMALAIALVLYALVGSATMRSLGLATLAASSAPLLEVAAGSGADWLVVLVRAGAAAASLGALLAMVAGIGRTALAMARAGDLPVWFAAVHPRYRVPHRAELVLGGVVCAMVVATDLLGALGFSSFGVLLYYLITNLAAAREGRGHRRCPRLLPGVGAVGCVVLAASLPFSSVVAGTVVLAVGLAYRWTRLRLTRGDRP